MLPPASEPSEDFTLIIPVFGDPRYYRNEEYLTRFKQNVMLALNVRMIRTYD